MMFIVMILEVWLWNPSTKTVMVNVFDDDDESLRQIFSFELQETYDLIPYDMVNLINA